MRVFTGTIPDYSSDAKGLLLSGVIGGGPAEAAGLQKGDVIVEIAGQSISEVLAMTQYDWRDLEKRMKSQIDTAIKADVLKPSEGMRLLQDFERGLKDQTYLSFE